MHVSEFFCLPRHATVLTGKTFRLKQSKTMFNILRTKYPLHCAYCLFATPTGCLPPSFSLKDWPALLPEYLPTLVTATPNMMLHVPLKCHTIHKLTLINLFISMYKIFKGTKNSLGFMIVFFFLLHSNHRHVSATHMAIFKAMTTKTVPRVSV
jgi:hypothetical protein